MNTLTPKPAMRVTSHSFTSYGAMRFAVTERGRDTWTVTLTQDGCFSASSEESDVPGSHQMWDLRETVTRYLFELAREHDARELSGIAAHP